MTTEENEIIEPVVPRSLNELLGLDTYQGMTDEEIDILIDYKVSIAESNAINSEVARANAAGREQLAQAQSESLAEVVAMVQSIRDSCVNIPLGVIADEQA